MKLLVFSAPWCGQCKAYHPVVDKFIKDHPQIEYQEINVEDESELSNKYDIRSLPTTIVLEGDNLVRKEVGILTYSQLEELI